LGAGGLYFYHSDHQGSSSVITDQLGSLVQHVEYVPFGEIFVEERASASSWQTPYLFNAKELDDETGLYYYGARYYDPRASVWLSVDPLAEKYPNVGSYVYCSNNPVIFIDPDGKEGHMFYKKDQKAEQRFALNYRNDNRIHIFSHGNKNGIEIYTNDGTVQNNVTVMNPGRFGELMEKSGSKVWGQYMEGKNETQLEVVLHGCETSELAKVLSEKYLDVYFTAPDEKNVSVNGKEKGPYKFVSIGLFKIFKGEWKTYENGKEVRSVKSDSPYPMNPLNGVEKPKDIEPYK
jgi:RHS repeat-associated protein